MFLQPISPKEFQTPRLLLFTLHGSAPLAIHSNNQRKLCVVVTNNRALANLDRTFVCSPAPKAIDPAWLAVGGLFRASCIIQFAYHDLHLKYFCCCFCACCCFYQHLQRRHRLGLLRPSLARKPLLTSIDWTQTGICLEQFCLVLRTLFLLLLFSVYLLPLGLNQCWVAKWCRGRGSSWHNLDSHLVHPTDRNGGKGLISRWHFKQLREKEEVAIFPRTMIYGCFWMML